MPTHMQLPARRDPGEVTDDWNKRTWVFPTLVGAILLGFALIYLFAVR